jgi:hypothetical protein
MRLCRLIMYCLKGYFSTTCIRFSYVCSLGDKALKGWDSCHDLGNKRDMWSLHGSDPGYISPGSGPVGSARQISVLCFPRPRQYRAYFYANHR